MAVTTTASFVSVEEYLHSNQRPDMEYIDGVLMERNVGEFDHGDVQWAVLAAINAFTDVTGIRARPEVRVQVSPTRFRVPDVCVMPAQWKRTPVVREAPLLCIEVVSPRDTVRELKERCDDYLAMGVPEAWILDPVTRIAHVMTLSGATEYNSGSLKLPGLALSVEVRKLFDVLNVE